MQQNKRFNPSVSSSRLSSRLRPSSLHVSSTVKTPVKCRDLRYNLHLPPTTASQRNTLWTCFSYLGFMSGLLSSHPEVQNWITVVWSVVHSDCMGIEAPRKPCPPRTFMTEPNGLHVLHMQKLCWKYVCVLNESNALITPFHSAVVCEPGQETKRPGIDSEHFSFFLLIMIQWLKG